MKCPGPEEHGWVKVGNLYIPDYDVKVPSQTPITLCGCHGECETKGCACQKKPSTACKDIRRWSDQFKNHGDE